MQDRRRNRPPRLAVTGGIGSGKSTALAFLRELGAATLSSDALVHEALREDGVKAAIGARHGGVLTDGRVDRSALARVVFGDERERLWLEGLLHPEVRRRIEQWAVQQSAAPQPPDLLAVEVPLLFEAGMADLFDAVVLVTAPMELRRRRTAAKLSKSDFERRAAQQMDEAQKAKLCDYVVQNTGSAVRLCEDLADVYADVLAGGPGPDNAGSPRRDNAGSPASDAGAGMTSSPEGEGRGR